MRNRWSIGFTLVELMVTIIIIVGIAGLLTGSYFKRYRGHKLTQYATRIKSYANYARLSSVEKGNVHYLILNEDRKIELCIELLDENGEKQFMPITNPYCRPFEIEENVEIISFDVQAARQVTEESITPGNSIKFYPEGGADSGVICLGGGNRVVTITVCETTGRARVFNGREFVQDDMKIDLDLGSGIE